MLVHGPSRHHGSRIQAASWLKSLSCWTPHTYSTSPAPTAFSHRVTGSSRMALSSHTKRCGIAATDYRPMPISEEPKEKPTIQPNPTQPNLLTLALAVPTKHGVSQPGLVCSNISYISTYLMDFR